MSVCRCEAAGSAQAGTVGGWEAADAAGAWRPRSPGPAGNSGTTERYVYPDGRLALISSASGCLTPSGCDSVVGLQGSKRGLGKRGQASGKRPPVNVEFCGSQLTVLTGSIM